MEGRLHSVDLRRNVEALESLVQLSVKASQQVLLNTRQFSHDHVRRMNLGRLGKRTSVQDAALLSSRNVKPVCVKRCRRIHSVHQLHALTTLH